MKTIEMTDIINLYKKCNIDASGNGTIRNTFNYGTLNNTLNVGADYVNTAKVDSVLRNNTVMDNNIHM